MHDEQPPKTIAVIAVHGVGNQPEFQTAREIADLLHGKDLAGSPAYSPFREHQLRVTVRPAKVVDRKRHKASKSGALGPFSAHVGDLIRDKAEPVDPDALSFEFMREQLRLYRNKPDDTYETIRLEGCRAGRESSKARDVHVYELHWSDLCRLQNRFFSILGELYQLMFHMSSLGSHTIGAAAAMHRDSKAWGGLRRWQDRASLSLTMIIPCLNLLMLGALAVVAIIGVFDRIGSSRGATITGALYAAAGAAGCGWLFWKRQERRFWLWIAPVVTWAATVGAILWTTKDWHPYLTPPVWRLFESILGALLTGGLLYVVLFYYNRRRPGVLNWAGWLHGEEHKCREPEHEAARPAAALGHVSLR